MAVSSAVPRTSLLMALCRAEVSARRPRCHDARSPALKHFSQCWIAGPPTFSGPRDLIRDGHCPLASQRACPVHHPSTHGRRLPSRGGDGGTERKPATIQRRVSAGSITSSTPNRLPVLSALPFS